MKSSKTMERWFTRSTHLSWSLHDGSSPICFLSLAHWALRGLSIPASLLLSPSPRGDNWVSIPRCISEEGPHSTTILHPQWHPGHRHGKDQGAACPLKFLVRVRWWTSQSGAAVPWRVQLTTQQTQQGPLIHPLPRYFVHPSAKVASCWRMSVCHALEQWAHGKGRWFLHLRLEPTFSFCNGPCIYTVALHWKLSSHLGIIIKLNSTILPNIKIK